MKVYHAQLFILTQSYAYFLIPPLPLLQIYLGLWEGRMMLHSLTD